MPLALSKMLKPITAPVGAVIPRIVEDARQEVAEREPQDDSSDTMSYDVRISDEDDDLTLDSSSVEICTPVNKSAGYSSGTGKSSLPVRLFKSIRTNLSKVNLLGRTNSASQLLTKQERKTSSRIDPIEEQNKIGQRISHFLSDVWTGTNEPCSIFVGEKEPPISFTSYVQRLIELTNKWVEEKDGRNSFGVRCAVMAVDYIEQMNVRLCPRSIHRYFAICVLLAIKLLYDYYISNSFWAEVSGCPRKQVNQMEVEMCRVLRWDFTVDSERHMATMDRFIR